MFLHLVLKIRGIFQRGADAVRTHSDVKHVYNNRGMWRLVGELMSHQFVVGTTGRAALGLALMEPEPDHGRVVFFACRQETRGALRFYRPLHFVFLPLLQSMQNTESVLPGSRNMEYIIILTLLLIEDCLFLFLCDQ